MSLAMGATDMDGQVPLSFAINQLYKRIQTNKLYPELGIPPSRILSTLTLPWFMHPPQAPK